jgi:hypothetical protein
MLLAETAKNLHCAADAISFAIDQGWTTPAQLCEIIRCSDSTLSRWKNGESEPGFNQITCLVRQHPLPDFKMLFPSVMVAATPVMLMYADGELDFNKDGRVDACDALAQIVEATARLAEQARKLAEPAMKGGRCRAMTPGEALDLRTRMAEVARLAASAVRVAEVNAARFKPRGTR